MRPRRLFVYGTLRDAKLRAALLGRSAARLRARPALLPGFRILCSPRGDWPVLGRSPKSRVPGERLESLAMADLRRLGRHEGKEYRLAVVRVLGSGRRWFSAFTYLPRHTKAGGRVWDFALWRARRMAAK